MRRLHLTVGLIGVVVFVLTGQVMRHHAPPMHELAADVRMMFVSRHIYLLGSTLVNLTLGLYLWELPPGWRRVFQQMGSLLLLISPILLTMAFFQEPVHGLAGRSWRSSFAIYALLAGGSFHALSFLGGADLRRELGGTHPSPSSG
jgi:hypothetical protein